MTGEGNARALAEFELTPEDWEDVNAVHLFDSALHRDTLRRVRILSVLLFATLALLTALLGFASGAVLFAIAGMAFPALIGPLNRRAQRRALRRISREGVANGTFGRHRVEVRDEGLFHATEAYESLIRWHAIEDVKDRDGHFLVYIGRNAFIPIPTTAFPDSVSLRRFADAFFERRAESARLEAGRQPDN